MIRVLIITLALVVHVQAGAAGKKDICEKYPPKFVTAVLIDVSDPLDPAGLLAYNSLAEQILKTTPDYSRLDLYKISSNSSGLDEPIISRCKPSGSTFAGEKFIEKLYRTEFYEPMSQKFSELGATPVSGKSSPILESVFNIALKSFTGRREPKFDDKSLQANKGFSGRLIVISDFMQHSSVLSFYGTQIPKYSDWRNSVSGRSWVRKFDRVYVYAIVIPRVAPNALPQAGGLFFKTYFSSNFDMNFSWQDIASASGNLGK